MCGMMNRFCFRGFRKFPGPKILCLLFTRNVFSDVDGTAYLFCQSSFCIFVGYGLSQCSKSHSRISCLAASLNQNLWLGVFLWHFRGFCCRALGNGMNNHSSGVCELVVSDFNVSGGASPSIMSSNVVCDSIVMSSAVGSENSSRT